MRVRSTPSSRRRRWALFALMFTIGLGFASWVVRTPAIRDAVHASTSEMGLILAGLSVGSMIGIVTASTLVPRRGTRPALQLGAGALVAGLTLVALSPALGAGWSAFAGLCFYGAGLGLVEVALNVEASEVERITARSALPIMHGCYSLGTFVGGLSGIALNAANVPVALHLGVVTLVLALVGAWSVAPVPHGTPAGRDEVAKDAARRASPSVWRDRRLLLLCIVLLGMAMAEGSAGDWLPLIVVEGFASSATTGSIVYSLFGLAMAVGRFGGDRVVTRVGRVTAMRYSAALGAVGIALVVLAPTLALAGVGVGLWGLGAALGFPMAMAAAADHPSDAARRVSAVSTAGYFAFLVGPPFIGVLGDHVGLRNAIVLVLVLVLAAGLAASSLRPTDRTPGALTER
ncbi:MFS transporter [Pseudonocardia halophobica]|uniref:MFS transporter n=1 Tax=Pseudonocardia halophobica TaxID=29401 RepID=UPI003D909795